MTMEDPRMRILPPFIRIASLPPAVQAEIAYHVAREEQVARICCVYPWRVPMDAMKEALSVLSLDPAQVEARLASGEAISELDDQLADVREAW